MIATIIITVIIAGLLCIAVRSIFRHGYACAKGGNGSCGGKCGRCPLNRNYNCKSDD